MLVALAVSCSAVSAATFPYLNDFSSAGLPNSNPPVNWTYDGANDQWDLDNSQTGSGATTLTSSVDITDINTSDFIMSTRFTFDDLANVTGGSAGNSVGFAAFAGSSDYSSGGYYLADWTTRYDVNNTTVRIIELNGDGNVSSVNGYTGTLPITSGKTYEMRLTGVYNEMGHLQMTLTVYDQDGDPLGVPATATDLTPLTGQYFGYRDRRVGSTGVSTSLDVDYDYLNIESYVPPVFPDLNVTVDRNTGNIILSNTSSAEIAASIRGYSITSASGALNPAQWKSVAGHYDAAGGGDGSVDSNDSWTILTNTDDNITYMDLSEYEFEGDGGQIGIGVDVNLSLAGGGPWIRSPIEDLVAEVQYKDGTTEEIPVYFVGNGGVQFVRSDLNFDGVVDELDWPTLRDTLLTDVSGLTTAQAYQVGDLNGDGLCNIVDFNIFEFDFDTANGAGSFAAMLQGVPEPSTIILLTCGVLGLAAGRRRRRFTTSQYDPDGQCWTIVLCAAPGRRVGHLKNTALLGILVLTAAAVCCNTAAAATFPYFNDFSSSGLPNATPSENWSHDAANEQWDLDVTIPQGGSSTAQISTIDITGIDTNGFVLSTRFTLEELDNPTGGTAGHSIGFTALAGAADLSTGGYYLADWTLRPDVSNTKLRIIGLGGDENTTGVEGSTLPASIVVGNSYELRFTGVYNSGNLDMTFEVYDGFGALLGSTTATDTTPLTGQYFGYRNRAVGSNSKEDNFDADFDYLNVEELAEYFQAVVHPVTGEVLLHNASIGTIDFNYYQIDGVADSLNSSTWNSLDDQNYSAIGGGEGESWDELGGSSNATLAEAFLQGSTALAPGESISLGEAYNTTTADENMTLIYRRTYSASPYEGSVEIAMLGDMDGDGDVDDDDVPLFVQALTDRAAFEANPNATSLDADFIGDMDGNGLLDFGDIGLFSTKVSLAASANTNAVPEPTTCGLLGVALFSLVWGYQRNNRAKR